jgi:hypothetical protein
MIESQTSSPSTRRKPRQPSSGYLFVVSGSAVFLAALVLGLGFRPRDPVKAVVAPVTIIDRVVPAEQSKKTEERLAAVATAIQSEESIRQALDLIGKYDAPLVDRSMNAEKFLKHLQVVVRPAASGNRHEILLDYRGSAAGATEVVNQLATTAVQQYERLFEQPARQSQFQAQQEATSAERKASGALRRYEEFISRLQPQLQDASDTNLSPVQGLKPAVESQESNSQSAMIQNPAWRELADQQQRLNRRRSELLEQMTVEHPVIRQLDVDLAQLDQSLSNTPRLIDNPDAIESPKSPAESATAEAIKDSPASPLTSEDQILAEKQRLRAESVAADQLVVTRQAELQIANAELLTAQNGRIEVLRWAEKPAMIRGTDGITVIVAALLAWLIGSAVAARGVPTDPTFTNPEEAATLLATPVLAVLPANEQCPSAIYPELPQGTRWAARASEFALAAMLFMALTLIIADQSFRSHLISHPLSSIPHGIDRFRDLMQS